MNYNFFSCLKPLLNALGWRGDLRRIFESIPHLRVHMDIQAFRIMMTNLNFHSRELKISLAKIDSELMPSLFVSKKQEIYILQEAQAAGIRAFNCLTNTWEILSTAATAKGTLYVFYPKKPEVITSKGWFFDVLNKFKTYWYQLLFLALLSNLSVILVPLFIMAVFDWVIPSAMDTTLTYLAGGMVLAIIALHVIHLIKGRILAYWGARLEMIITTEVMRHLLYMPFSMVENSSLAGQVVRLKQFNATREIFTGPVAQLFLEMPFIWLFVVVIGIIGGPIAIIPLVLFFIFLVMGLFLMPFVHRSTSHSSAATQAKQGFLIETLGNLINLKYLSAQDTWLKRFHKLSTDSSISGKNNEELINTISAIAQFLMKLAGLVAVIWGAVRVMDNNMSVGSLIAVVILIWRALSPIQNLFLTLSRLDMIKSSIAQLNNLMKLPVEKRVNSQQRYDGLFNFAGLVRFENVGFRYPNEFVPAIQGVGFEAKPGEIVAIIGGNGSGKSTIFKLLLSFYQPQVGILSIDGMDIRQYDPIFLRQAIAFAPQQAQFFHGTIAQNLRLSAPESTEEQIWNATKQAGLLETVLALPEGFDTKINDRILSEFSSGFRQRLNLARAYIRNSKILLLDEPGNTLDYKSDELLKKTILTLKPQSAIILTTHRPSLIRLADNILVMSNGQMQMFGPRDKVLELLKRPA